MSQKNRSRWHAKPASQPAATTEPRIAPTAASISAEPPALSGILATSAVETQSSTPTDFAPISPAQLAANRANAQLSTGPRTTAGKAKSSKNAVRTGLTGQTVLLPADDVEEYTAFVAGFTSDFAPVGPAECELVQSIANTHWRLRRIRALEFALYTHGHNQFENAFDDYPEEDRYNMILLQTHMTYEKQFRNFQIQEARLDRKRARDLDELLRLQTERKSNQQETIIEEDDVPELEAIFARREAILAEHPVQQENGFEFSNAVAPFSSVAQAPTLAASTNLVDA